MEYANIQGIDNPVSKIIFGCCNPVIMNDSYDAETLLDAAYEEGINTFDLAKVYGKAEEVFGRWVSSGNLRDKVVVITKGCHPDEKSRINPQALKEDIESSLDRLQTDYIDIYMLHRDDENADMNEMLTELNRYIRQGIIRKIGVSNWRHERIEAVNEQARELGLTGFTISSPQMSPARQIRDPWGGGCVSISGDESAFKWYTKHPDISVFAYSCLAHGFFSGKIRSTGFIGARMKLDGAAKRGYWSFDNLKRLRNAEKIARERNCSVSQVALAWCMAQSFRVHPTVTASSVKRIRENIESLGIRLSKEEIERLM